MKALSNFSVEFPKGISGLIGPNGAGKTTLINILVGLIKPDSGKVRVFALDPWLQRHELMKKVGVVFEENTYPQEVTCFRYLKHIASLRGIKSEEVVNALCQVGLSKVSERKIANLSAGMKKRVGIAKAILGNPELVIMDEPSANLDPVGRIKLLKIIKRMHDDMKINFLISSHVLPELQKVCSWACLMYKGKAIEYGFVKDLLDKYAPTIYVAKATKPQALLDMINKTDELKAYMKGDRLYIRGNLTLIRRKVPEFVQQIGCELIDFHQVNLNLENVFIESLRRKGGQSIERTGN
ncbi:MAG: ABC transporter ATP-binding protein [Thermoproteota archaeon]